MVLVGSKGQLQIELLWSTQYCDAVPIFGAEAMATRKGDSLAEIGHVDGISASIGLVVLRVTNRMMQRG